MHLVNSSQNRHQVLFKSSPGPANYTSPVIDEEKLKELKNYPSQETTWLQVYDMERFYPKIKNASCEGLPGTNLRDQIYLWKKAPESPRRGNYLQNLEQVVDYMELQVNIYHLPNTTRSIEATVQYRPWPIIVPIKLFEQNMKLETLNLPVDMSSNIPYPDSPIPIDGHLKPTPNTPNTHETWFCAAGDVSYFPYVKSPSIPSGN